MSRYIDADALKEFVDDCGICAICPQKAPRCVYDCDFPDAMTPKWELLINAQPSIDIVHCSECRWARPRTLKGETGYRCLFYRVDKAENGYCDVGERGGE